MIMDFLYFTRIDFFVYHSEFFPVPFNIVMPCCSPFWHLGFPLPSISQAIIISPFEILMAIHRFFYYCLDAFLRFFCFGLQVEYRPIFFAVFSSAILSIHIVFLYLIRIFCEPITPRTFCDSLHPIHIFFCFLRKFFFCFAIVLFIKLPILRPVCLSPLLFCTKFISPFIVLFLNVTHPVIF